MRSLAPCDTMRLGQEPAAHSFIKTTSALEGTETTLCTGCAGGPGQATQGSLPRPAHSHRPAIRPSKMRSASSKGEAGEGAGELGGATRARVLPQVELGSGITGQFFGFPQVGQLG